MSISSISSNTSTYLPTQSNSEIKALEKQKERLQSQIQKTKESDTDTRTKQELIKQLQEQIKQIDAQIQQKRSEQMSEKLEQSKSKQENNDQSSTTKTEAENNANGICAKSMTDFFEASTTYEQSKIMSDTKEKLNGRGGVLSQEIALNEARGVDSTGKRSELAELKARSMNLNLDIGEALHDSAEQAGNAAETESANNAESNNGVNGADAEAEASAESDESQNEETAASGQEENAQQVWIVYDRNKKVDVLA